MARRRGHYPLKQWSNGPAKLCQAFAVDGTCNGLDMCTDGAGLWIEDGSEFPDGQVLVTPRVGIDSVPEPWRSLPWRFLAQETKK
jgi:DNA-3-methyladenine glycosylase